MEQPWMTFGKPLARRRLDMTANYREFFAGRTLVLGTKHKKEKVIAPILERELGVRVIVPDNFDTDQFGTFTREIARAGNQLEAARRKATAAMDLLGADFGHWQGDALT